MLPRLLSGVTALAVVLLGAWRYRGRLAWE